MASAHFKRFFCTSLSQYSIQSLLFHPFLCFSVPFAFRISRLDTDNNIIAAQWTLIWHSSKSSNESRKKTGDVLTPDDYRARDTSRVAQFRKEGKMYVDATTISIDRVQRFWDRWVIQ